MRKTSDIFLISFGAIVAAVLLLGGTAQAEPNDAEAQGAPDEDENIENVEVIGTQLPSSPLSIYVDSKMLAGIPGTNDDPLTAIITLPGVAVNNDFQGGVAIRGTRPVDNTYRIDFMQVGYLFHFGTGGVVDGDLADGFSFHPAGYGARFQDVIGGAVDVRTRDPNSDEFGGVVDANLVHAGVLVEGPVSDRQRGYFSARASYYNLVLEPYLEEINDDEEDDVDLIQLPAFHDYRGRYQIDVGESSQIDLLIDGASDEVELLFQDDTTEVLQDPALAGAHRFGLEYHRQAIVYAQDARRTSGLQSPPLEAGLARNVTAFTARLGGAGDVDTRITDTSFRLEAALQNFGIHHLSLGGTVSQLDVDYDVVLRNTGCTEFEVDCRFSDAEVVTAQDRLQFVRARVFLENSMHINDRIIVALGAAYTGDDYLNRRAFEPRASLVWQWRPRTALMIATGKYHQMPAFEYIEQNLGNPGLQYLGAEHYVAGLEHRFKNGWSVKAEAYEKDSHNLVTANAASRYDNRGSGKAIGGELLVRGHFGPRLLGWAALSYAKSERKDLDSGETFDFEYDQPVIASLVARFRLNDSVSFSGKAWYHSGAPHSPIIGGEPDPDNPGGFLPIYGEINSERLPSYFRLDLRADWELGRWRNAKMYFEVQNATNHHNVAGYEYEADYSDRESVTQIPWFVSVGVRKAW